MIALVVLLVIIPIFIIGFCSEGEMNDVLKGVLMTLSIVMLIAAGYLITIISPNNIKASKFEISKEIRIESVNGEEISRDTIYIFTPRKEKSNHNLSMRVCK